MIIREAAIADLPAMEPAAQAFYASSKELHHFRIERFVNVWTNLIHAGSGVIFLAEADGKIEGAIGGVIHEDLYGGQELIAEEFFWFIQPGSRGDGIRLYRRFKDWAIQHGAAELQMVHLSDSMPDKLARFYKHEGYSLIEMRHGLRLA
jgi:GNAT superfamily N-acetyltransferase